MIKIGTNITLEQDTNDGNMESYRCRMVEIKGHTVYIDYPINLKTGRTDIFPKGTKFRAYYLDDKEYVYQFDTEIKGKKVDKVPMLLLHFDTSKVKKIQRREYLRVDANLDVSVHDPINEMPPFTTLTADISGGGMAILLPEDHGIKSGAEINIWIVIPLARDNIIYLPVKAKAIRVHEMDKRNHTLLSLEFTSITENDRQHIIQYCFDTQLKERRQQYQ